MLNKMLGQRMCVMPGRYKLVSWKILFKSGNTIDNVLQRM
jgi:hypothetical protein